METTPDSRRETLRQFIADNDLQVSSWAKQSGVNANSIYNFLGERSGSLNAMAYAKLARTAGVPVWRLTGEQPDIPPPTSIAVSGHVEAGNFRPAVMWDETSWYYVDVPVPARFRSMAKGLEVRGSSMNMIYNPGAVVIWVDMLNARPPRDRDRVIVYTRMIDDGIEATVKELRVVNGEQWLWPRSDDPEHQQPINPRQPPRGIDAIEIVGLVIGSYQPEIF